MLKITTKLGEKKKKRERDKFNTTTLEKNFRRKKKYSYLTKNKIK